MQIQVPPKWFPDLRLVSFASVITKYVEKFLMERRDKSERHSMWLWWILYNACQVESYRWRWWMNHFTNGDNDQVDDEKKTRLMVSVRCHGTFLMIDCVCRLCIRCEKYQLGNSSSGYKKGCCPFILFLLFLPNYLHGRIFTPSKYSDGHWSTMRYGRRHAIRQTRYSLPPALCFW